MTRDKVSCTSSFPVRKTIVHAVMHIIIAPTKDNWERVGNYAAAQNWIRSYDTYVNPCVITVIAPPFTFSTGGGVRLLQKDLPVLSGI